jgi:transcription termination factor Rho
VSQASQESEESQEIEQVEENAAATVRRPDQTAPDYPEPDYEIDELRRLGHKGGGRQLLLGLAAKEEAQSPGALEGLSSRELVARVLFARGRRDSLGMERGILEVRPEGFGFLRSVRHDYQSGPDDVYISPNQIRRLRLRDGDEVVGPTRPPKGDEAYFALWRVDRVNGLEVRDLFRRVPFLDLTPVLPRQPLRLSHAGGDELLRLLEVLAPMALGHRVLIRVPPMFSAIGLLGALAEGIRHNHPKAWVLVLQIGERPEEHVELRRRLDGQARCEVSGCTFSEATARQVAVCRFVMARARRLVETGQDVVLIVDSLTSLVHANNMEVPHSGKIIGPELDANALHLPKVLFGNARSAEEGGSLTVFATVKQGAGPMDQIVAEQFRDRANAEIVLDEELCELFGHVGIDVRGTRTRREDNPTDPIRQQQLHKLRQDLGAATAKTALSKLRERVGGVKDNDELLASG